MTSENGEEDDEDYDDDDDDDEAPAGADVSRVDIQTSLRGWMREAVSRPKQPVCDCAGRRVRSCALAKGRLHRARRAADVDICQGGRGELLPAHQQPRPTTTATADEMRPLLGSPTSGGGLTGLQASLDKQLDDLRSKWDTLFRQKEASSNAGGLSDEQRRRAQEELQRALGGFRGRPSGTAITWVSATMT